MCPVPQAQPAAHPQAQASPTRQRCEGGGPLHEQRAEKHKQIEDRKAEKTACGAIVLLVADPESKQQESGTHDRNRHAVGEPGRAQDDRHEARSEEHTSELQSLMRLSYAVFCLNKKTTIHTSFTYIYNTPTKKPLPQIP